MAGSWQLPKHVPVLVVGAGPTGLLSANLLGTYGVETLLVERNATTSDLPKAILIDDEGLRTLQAVGLADETPLKGSGKQGLPLRRKPAAND